MTAIQKSMHGVGASLMMMAAVITANAQTSTNVAATPGQVTFTKDVAPILQEKCQTCHRAGGIAPMSLTDLRGDSCIWAKADQAARGGADDAALVHRQDGRNSAFRERHLAERSTDCDYREVG